MTIKLSKLMNRIPENVFEPIFKIIAQANDGRGEVLNAGVGIPDRDTPELLLSTLEKVIRKPENMRYGSFSGKPSLLKEIARWLKEEYDIEVNPEKEIALLFGSKSGLSSLPSVLLNPGDTVLLPVPSYPDYLQGIRLAGAEIEDILLKEDNDYLIEYSKISEESAQRARLLYLNYPSNPIGAVASEEFYEETVKWAKKNDVLVLQDHAYSDFYYKEGKSACFIKTEGAKDIGVEYFSFSKNFSLSGLRIGFAVGNETIIQGIKDYNNIFHANIYGAVQDVSLEALKNYKELTSDIKSTYMARREKLCSALESLGYKFFYPQGGIFIWLRVKEGYTSQSFFELLLHKYRIITMPGHVFGKGGEEFIRVSLSLKDAEIDTLIERLSNI